MVRPDTGQTGRVEGEPDPPRPPEIDRSVHLQGYQKLGLPLLFLIPLLIRVGIIYIFLLVGLKLMGKREFSQLSSFEFVTLLIIPEIVSQALVRADYSLTNALIGVSTLLVLVFTVSVVTHISPKLEKVVPGEPSIIVRHGFMIDDTMNQERVSPTEVFSEMHKAGIEDLSQVKWGILEADGTMSFVQWEESAGTSREKRRV